MAVIMNGNPELDDDTAFRTYGLQQEQQQPIPVGERVEPVNKLNVLTPYLALLGLIASAVVVVALWSKRESLELLSQLSVRQIGSLLFRNILSATRVR